MKISTPQHMGLLCTDSVTIVDTTELAQFAHAAVLHDDIEIDGVPHVVDQLDERVLSVAVDTLEEDGIVVTLVTKRTIHMHKGHT